jgi:hypothetical protein
LLRRTRGVRLGGSPDGVNSGKIFCRGWGRGPAGQPESRWEPKPPPAGPSAIEPAGNNSLHPKRYPWTKGADPAITGEPPEEQARKAPVDPDGIGPSQPSQSGRRVSVGKRGGTAVHRAGASSP